MLEASSEDRVDDGRDRVESIWVSGVMSGYIGDINVWQANNAIRRFCACNLLP